MIGNAPVPPQFTADGANAAPALNSTDLPQGVEQVALIVDDSDPGGEQIDFERTRTEGPPHPKEINPQPHGVELRRLIQMLSNTKSRSMIQIS